MRKRAVIALGHRALGTTLPEQMVAVKNTAKSIADLLEEGYQIAITHSNAPQVGMIHTAMNEFGKSHPNYTAAPMSVCSAMSQGYIGYDLQNGIREELLNPGSYLMVRHFTRPPKYWAGTCLFRKQAKSAKKAITSSRNPAKDSAVLYPPPIRWRLWN